MISVVGLGPGELARVPSPVRAMLEDPAKHVIARTEHHPAAAQLAASRAVVFCDDLYESSETFDEIYSSIADRVLSSAGKGDVIYAVPGSPSIGEFAVKQLFETDVPTELVPGESFVDAMLTELGYDPLDRGLQILNGHELPDPLVLDKPTIVAHLDRPEVLSDVCAQVERALPEETTVILMSGVGSPDAVTVKASPNELDSGLASNRTSLFIDSEPGGLIGAVHTMRVLREECPWDREQTHATLVKNLVEETFELVEAIDDLEDELDWAGYAALEDELGDVLLQVLFHATIARQAGAFDIDDVGQVLREKLIRRHPHVFGDVEADSPDDVKRNWDQIKQAERGVEPDSALDGVSAGLPALQRASKVQNKAAKVGFDWQEASQVLPKIQEELDELSDAINGRGEIESELGDLMFSIVNIARHLGLDPELALRGSTKRFEARFRQMEAAGSLDGLDLEALDARWEQAKKDLPTTG